MDWEDETHCGWAVEYLVKQGFLRGRHYIASHKLQEMIAVWPSRIRSPFPNSSPDPASYILLEGKMRSAYSQWKKRRREGGHKTYNLWMTKGVSTHLHHLARRQKMTISEAVEELIRQEDVLSQRFQKEFDRRIEEMRQKQKRENEHHKAQTDRYDEIINELIGRIARLELDLEGLPEKEAPSDPSDQAAWSELLEEKIGALDLHYKLQVKAIVRPRKAPGPKLSRPRTEAYPSDDPPF
jgi:FtsZ-binding cell division protein ZapB|tara:strand:+ start:551 stop:1267 length:717 start_codon:yes stop_codon:yes gene_type:complete